MLKKALLKIEYLVHVQKGYFTWKDGNILNLKKQAKILKKPVTCNLKKHCNYRI